MTCRQLVFVIFSILALDACSGGAVGGKAVPPSMPLSPQKWIVRVHVPDASKRGLSYDRRMTDSSGQVQKGFKVRGLHRTYWFPPEARFTKMDSTLVVVAYHHILAFPLRAAQLRNNEAASDSDLDAVPDEQNPVVKIYAHNRIAKTTSGITRSPQYLPNSDGGGGWCDAWNWNCVCPDCMWDPTAAGIGPNDPLAITLGDRSYYWPEAYDCVVNDYADPYDFQICLSGSGPGGIFPRAIRQNVKSYIFYSGNFDTVLTPQANPVAAGATNYSYTFQGILGSTSGYGLFFPYEAKGDVEIHVYPTPDGILSVTRATYYGIEPDGESGPIGSSLAKYATLNLGSSDLGT